MRGWAPTGNSPYAWVTALEALLIDVGCAVVRVAASTGCVEMAYVTPLAVNTIAGSTPASVCSPVKNRSGTLVATTDPSMVNVTLSAGLPGIVKRLVRTSATGPARE